MNIVLSLIKTLMFAGLIGILIFIIFIPIALVLANYFEFMLEKIDAYFENKR
jgi:hypothetical protein